jgi:hypothetical protein
LHGADVELVLLDAPLDGIDLPRGLDLAIALNHVGHATDSSERRREDEREDQDR